MVFDARHKKIVEEVVFAIVRAGSVLLSDVFAGIFYVLQSICSLVLPREMTLGLTRAAFFRVQYETRQVNFIIYT
jgi:hypothetical protein